MTSRIRYLTYWGINIIVNLAWMFLSSILNKIPRSKNKWIFISHVDQGFADNTKYFFLEHYNSTNRKFYWVTNNKKILKLLSENNYRCVLRGSWKYYILCITAEYVVFDSYLRNSAHYLTLSAKRINLWHGVGPKKTDFDIDVGRRQRFYQLGIKQKFFAIVAPHLYQHKYTSAFLTTSSTYVKISLQAFRLTDEQIIYNRYPRVDFLLQDTKLSHLIGSNQHIYDIFTRSDKRKIVYAPTFRDEREESSVYSIDKILEYVSHNILSSNDILIYKGHIAKSESYKINSDNILILDEHEDFYPYLKEADILITDYSSIASDFMMLKKPIIYFCYDYDFYIRNCRGFYFDLHDLSKIGIARDYLSLKEQLDFYRNNNFQYGDAWELFHDTYQIDNLTSLLSVIEQHHA